MAKEVTLPSGKKAVIGDFKGKHIREAQRIAGGNTDMITFALISLTTTIDDQPVLAEDLDEMEGRDVMALMGEFSENFTSAPKN